jgi:hypothetical protein
MAAEPASGDFPFGQKGKASFREAFRSLGGSQQNQDDLSRHFPLFLVEANESNRAKY